MQSKVIYPGTFDPITLGHADVVERAACMFEQVVVAVADSTSKNTLFDTDERIQLAADVLARIGNVQILVFNGLLIDFARSQQAALILRGLRAVSDYEYELQLAGLNRRMAPEIDTIFLTPSEQYSNISSSLVREIARLGGDVSEFVHPIVLDALNQRFT